VSQNVPFVSRDMKTKVSPTVSVERKFTIDFGNYEWTKVELSSRTVPIPLWIFSKKRTVQFSVLLSERTNYRDPLHEDVVSQNSLSCRCFRFCEFLHRRKRKNQRVQISDGDVLVRKSNRRFQPCVLISFSVMELLRRDCLRRCFITCNR
jgi:hypothetical protein